MIELTKQEIISLAPEVIEMISYHWLAAFVILLIISQIVKYINIWFKDEKVQSTLGLLIITPFTWLAFKWYYAYEEMIWLDTLLLVIGAAIGFFTYILDDLAREAWKNRNITIPLLCGLAWGATWTVSAKFNEWKQVDAEVISVASQSRAEVYKYVYDSCCSSDDDGCNSCYRWEYQAMYEKTVASDSYPILIEGEDYILGRGEFGRKDRVNHLYYRAYALGDGEDYTWYQAYNSALKIDIGSMVRLGLNFHNQIIREIKDGNYKNQYAGLPINSIEEAKNVFPPGGPTAKVLNSFTDFFKRLISDESYRPLRKMYGILYLVMFTLLLFKQTKQPAAIFIISSLIIPLLILSFIMMKSGTRFSDFKFWGPRPRWWL